MQSLLSSEIPSFRIKSTFRRGLLFATILAMESPEFHRFKALPQAAQQTLQQLRQQHLYRSLESFPFAGGKWGKHLSFSANDYLNLAHHPKLTQAAIAATEQYGSSAASSRLLSGHLYLHQELEQKLACWSGYPAALSFGSGYLTNIGVLQTVLEADALVLFDRLNHASLIDGLRLAQASQPQLKRGKGLQWQRYRHCDLADLEHKLQTARQRPVWLLSDSVFSMDGDVAPLLALAQLAEKYQFRWLLDEAHAVGIYGPSGGGLVQALALYLQQHPELPGCLPDLVTGNFAKALGSYGGYCLCGLEWKELLVNRCRSLIYSTGLPPASTAAALAAIQIIEEEALASKASAHTSADSPALVLPQLNAHLGWEAQPPNTLFAGLGKQLLERSQQFYQSLLQAFPSCTGFLSSPLCSPIIPFMVKHNNIALAVTSELRQSGIIVKAIRSPTVALGTARLRFSLSLAHSPSDFMACVHALEKSSSLSICLQENESKENKHRTDFDLH